MANPAEWSIDVNVDVTTAYNQWTQFESFPQFMQGVRSVRQLDDRHVHWVVEIAGRIQEWDAEITDQQPDRLIAWRSVRGRRTSGLVTFAPTGRASCLIHLRLEYQPEGALERAGSALGIVDRTVKEDLVRFKSFIERRGTATGVWRGELAA